MLKKKIEDALNAQINAEMWSAYLYLSMAAYCHAQGQPGMGKWFEVQFKEEQDHAKILFNYVISRNGKVDLRPIEAVPGHDVSRHPVLPRDGTLNDQGIARRPCFKLYAHADRVALRREALGDVLPFAHLAEIDCFHSV